MNELNDKAINICQAIIGFKLGVSDDEKNQAIDAGAKAVEGFVKAIRKK